MKKQNLKFAALAIFTISGLVLTWYVLHTHPHKKNYNIEVDGNGAYLYDGDRPVGRFNYHGSSLDSLILKDNK